MQHLQNPCCNVAWDCYFLVSTRLWSFKLYQYGKIRLFVSSPLCRDWLDQQFCCPKGQIKPKAVWARQRFSQKTNKQICFGCREKQTSKQNKFICLFFGRIYGMPICFQFYLTFSQCRHRTTLQYPSHMLIDLSTNYNHKLSQMSKVETLQSNIHHFSYQCPQRKKRDAAEQLELYF